MKIPIIAEYIICIILITMTLCSILVAILPSLNFIANHGKHNNKKKMNNNKNNNIIIMILNILSKLEVSKSLFKYMYWFGIIISFYHIIFIIMNTNIQIMDCLINLLMLEFHLIRRLWECYYCTIYGNSLMNISGLLCGLVHYFVVPLCIIYGNNNNDNNNNCILSQKNSIFLWKSLSITIFFVANYFQFESHLILYKLKIKYSESYTLPTDSMFKYVCCPHYLMEILIYISFWMSSPCSLSLICLQLWVISNLSVVANQNLTYYKEKFKDKYDLKNWKRIFPYLW